LQGRHRRPDRRQQHGGGAEISPRYKHFVNACQERFWLRMHA
ncbi:hypothetical protein ACLBVB_18270, partial [Pseudomonas aeruginosa]